MMEYEKISEPLFIHFESEDLDLLQVGILNSSLHEILNQVAITVLNEENAMLEREGRKKLLEFIPQSLSRQDILVRARIIGISEGSIEFNLQPFLAQVLSEPGAGAILHNLVANTIWAIGHYGTRVVGSRIKGRKNSERISEVLPGTSARRRLRPRVENLLKHLKDASNGGRIILRSGDEELIIEFYGTEDRER
jgi:hypothetical protein